MLFASLPILFSENRPAANDDGVAVTECTIQSRGKHTYIIFYLFIYLCVFLSLWHDLVRAATIWLPFYLNIVANKNRKHLYLVNIVFVKRIFVVFWYLYCFGFLFWKLITFCLLNDIDIFGSEKKTVFERFV